MSKCSFAVWACLLVTTEVGVPYNTVLGVNRLTVQFFLSAASLRFEHVRAVTAVAAMPITKPPRPLRPIASDGDSELPWPLSDSSTLLPAPPEARLVKELFLLC